ncbi:MAG: manganese efflux pump MntP family protein [Bacteroidales bacterium]|nr:manganese efflux pump MntP family protein [Bacteroidales bacterium]
MDFFAVLFVSIGLSFDTFAVSLSCGIKEKNIQFLAATRIAIVFAIFQALMPLLGWFLGITISNYVVSIDHWIAFVLLWIIGIKMVLDAWNHEKNDSSLNINDPKVIISLSLATTMDAFVIGITFAFLKVHIPMVLLIIGATTYIFSMLGMLFGKKLGQHIGNKVEFLGGIILMAIGLKILLEHLQH